MPEQLTCEIIHDLKRAYKKSDGPQFRKLTEALMQSGIPLKQQFYLSQALIDSAANDGDQDAFSIGMTFLSACLYSNIQRCEDERESLLQALYAAIAGVAECTSSQMRLLRYELSYATVQDLDV